jgi:hypothetical protein
MLLRSATAIKYSTSHLTATGCKPFSISSIKTRELYGFFIDPTVFMDVTLEMRIAREEIFGPVISVLRWDDEAARRHGTTPRISSQKASRNVTIPSVSPQSSCFTFSV